MKASRNSTKSKPSLPSVFCPVKRVHLIDGSHRRTYGFQHPRQVVEYLDFAVELARAAGDILRRYMSGEKQVELKGHANLVTVADKESEALIIKRIRER